MLHEISPKINYVAEGIALLHHLGIEQNFPAIKESLSKKYDITFQAGIQKFELLSRIEQNARNIFQEELEEIRYYFSAYGVNESDYHNNSCAGMLALLWRTHSPKDYENIEELRHFLQSLSEKEYCEKFGEELQFYHELLRDESKTQKIEEPLAIISYLMKMEIPDNEKWKIQKVFCDRYEHQEKILALLDKAISVLTDFRPELEELTAHFCRYWKQTLKERSIASYLRESAAIIELGENPLGFCLTPSIINCNSFAISANMEEDGTYQSPDTCSAGILFDDDFHIWTSRTEGENTYMTYAAQVLKLLSDKSKFEILSYIRDKESYGSELARHLNLTTPTVSHHMNALIAAELVTIKRKETRVYYLSNKEKIDEVLRYCRKILTDKDETALP